MKLTVNQLRRLIKEEVFRVVSEGAVSADSANEEIEPTGIMTPGGGEIYISYFTAPAGVFGYLLASGVDASKIAKARPSTFDPSLTFILTGPKGKFSKDKAGAEAVLRSAAAKEVRAMSANPDARPSETRRLELLQAFVNG